MLNSSFIKQIMFDQNLDKLMVLFKRTNMTDSDLCNTKVHILKRVASGKPALF